VGDCSWYERGWGPHEDQDRDREDQTRQGSHRNGADVLIDTDLVGVGSVRSEAGIIWGELDQDITGSDGRRRPECKSHVDLATAGLFSAKEKADIHSCLRF
jgi:hypothetical protein